MKARIKPTRLLTEKEKKALSDWEAQVINEQVELIVSDAFRKIMWTIAAAAHEEFGFGFIRGARLLDAIRSVLEQYNGWKKDDVADYMLARYLTKIGYDVKDLYEREG